MTSANRRLEWVEHALASVGQARDLFLLPTPEALDTALPALERAASLIASLENDLRTNPEQSGSALPGAVNALRNEVARARSLLDSAAEYHLGWANLLYAQACGYTPRGDPAAPAPSGRLCLEG